MNNFLSAQLRSTVTHKEKPVEQAEGLWHTFKSPVIAEKSKGLGTPASVSSPSKAAVDAAAAGASSSSAALDEAFDSSTFPAISRGKFRIWTKLAATFVAKTCKNSI